MKTAEVNTGKVFTSNDIVKHSENSYHRIYIDKDKDLVYSPLWYHKQGLMQTRTGYGRKLNTGYKINFEGRLYRIYCTIFSNAGTSFFTRKGEMIIVD